MWVLIMTVCQTAANAGCAITTRDFPTEQSCLVAAEKLTEETKRHVLPSMPWKRRPTATVEAVCIPGE